MSASQLTIAFLTTSAVTLGTMTTVIGQAPAPGQLHACTRNGSAVGWVSAAAPELALGFITACPIPAPVAPIVVVPYPPPAPVDIPLQLEVGHYYETAYNETFVVTGEHALQVPAGRYFGIQYITPSGGFCGRIALRRVDRAHRGVYREVAPRAISLTCPMQISIDQ